MPVRSLSSPVLKWPDRATVDRAVRRWAAAVAGGAPDVVAVGYFGSYARGDWGVGSDVDVVVLLAGTDEPFERRALRFPATGLPVPADVLVYTEDEWRSGLSAPGLARRAAREMVWAYPRGVGPGSGGSRE